MKIRRSPPIGKSLLQIQLWLLFAYAHRKEAQDQCNHNAGISTPSSVATLPISFQVG